MRPPPGISEPVRRTATFSMTAGLGCETNTLFTSTLQMFRFVLRGIIFAARSHKRLIGKTSHGAKVQKPMQNRNFLEIKRLRDSLRYKTAVMINSTAPTKNQTPPVPRRAECEEEERGDVTMTASAKYDFRSRARWAMNGCEGDGPGDSDHRSLGTPPRRTRLPWRGD